MKIDIEEYYKRYSPMVFRRCRFMLRDEDLALDATQEVFLKVLEKKDTLRNEYPSSLLYKIATNHCLNMIKSGRHADGYGSDEILMNIASCEELPEERVIIKEMIDSIFNREKVSTREIAVMYYIDNMTHEEIAEEVSMSVSGVRKRLRNLKLNAQKYREEL
jgi:RNA polymerase sigma factor (sigma-70 family)